MSPLRYIKKAGLPFIRQACRKIVYGQLMLLPAFTYLLLNGLHALCRSVSIFHHFNVQSLLRVANPSAREVVIFRRHNIGDRVPDIAYSGCRCLYFQVVVACAVANAICIRFLVVRREQIDE